MSQRPRRPWTETEDSILRRFVESNPEYPRWCDISKSLPGRTPKDCRKRWVSSLDAVLTKGPWTSGEDSLLRKAVELHGTDWAAVSRAFAGRRSGDQCSKRWRQVVNPTINRDPWSENEDRLLLQLYGRHNNSWQLISTYFSNRTDLQCRNRCCHLLGTRSQSKTEKRRLMTLKTKEVVEEAVINSYERRNSEPSFFHASGGLDVTFHDPTLGVGQSSGDRIEDAEMPLHSGTHTYAIPSSKCYDPNSPGSSAESPGVSVDSSGGPADAIADFYRCMGMGLVESPPFNSPNTHFDAYNNYPYTTTAAAAPSHTTIPRRMDQTHTSSRPNPTYFPTSSPSALSGNVHAIPPHPHNPNFNLNLNFRADISVMTVPTVQNLPLPLPVSSMSSLSSYDGNGSGIVPGTISMMDLSFGSSSDELNRFQSMADPCPGRGGNFLSHSSRRPSTFRVTR
ncbi:hypothetical protein GYMLUDRAFT_73637 [Collybiopsis luxurians FD-317 M1]|uniref:Uncharacterized protein n=1 Tax=Collybiopsis luxurians FD-317 M1 TaxID=944289 RepID=A0A0D0CPJ1_9AGAR|nr:hypothetical protein GYMLUDRAFT_73637 [Collybiopsis luxurians FD-317 M1]